jgi:hypothetical protein
MNANVMSDRDEDDDDDDDEEDSEYDEESKDKSKDTLRGSPSTSLIDDGKENEEFPNEHCENDELNNQQAGKAPYASTANACELMSVKNDSALMVDVGPPIHPNSYEYMKSAEKSSIPYFQPISINTEMFPSSHNRDYKVSR